MQSDLEAFASVFFDVFMSKRFDDRGLAIESLSPDQAYGVQEKVIQRRMERGERPIGYKIGCTSDSIRRQFGLREPICGRVMQPHVFWGDAELCISDYCQPAIEPEFVLTIGKDLADVPSSDEELLEAIDYVSPGIELHNYRFWFGQPTLQELIASNGIHAALVIGNQKVHPGKIDWTMEGVGVFRDDKLVASGIAADILGGPLNSLRWLLGHVGGLKAGEIVIPGSAVELVPVRRGDRITARFTHAGSVLASFQ